MAAAAHAEHYLRLRAERALLDSERGGPHGSALQTAAGAFVAAGALSPELARSIVEEYGLAFSLRGQGVPRSFFQRPTLRLPGRTLTAPRIVVVRPSTLSYSWGTLEVHYAVLGDATSDIAATAQLTGVASAGPAGHPPQIAVTDDTGNTLMAGFNGGGQPGGWKGMFSTRSALSGSTRWLDLDNHRVELSDEAGSAADVWVEELPPRPDALAYLWHSLAVRARPGPRGDVEEAIDALVAIGELDESMTEVGQIRQVANSLWGPGPSPTSLPEPWNALVLRPPGGRRRGPLGMVPIAAVTPPIDGVQVLLEVLMSEPDGLAMQVSTSPGVNFGGPFHADLDEPSIAWWAEDDRGGVYLGHANRWSGGPDGSRGTIQFSSPINPDARELRVMPTGLTKRAVARVLLPWRVTT
jgi:hypothetical protein